MLNTPRKIMIMVKAGQPVDDVIDELLPLLDKGDLLIDGGNSFFRDTERRNKSVTDKGFRYIGTGVSGGEEGALWGPSIMPGGSPEAYEMVRPMLEGDRRQGEGRALRDLHRSRRRRPLREDGAQWHRVR